MLLATYMWKQTDSFLIIMVLIVYNVLLFFSDTVRLAIRKITYAPERALPQVSFPLYFMGVLCCCYAIIVLRGPLSCPHNSPDAVFLLLPDLTNNLGLFPLFIVHVYALWGSLLPL